MSFFGGQRWIRTTEVWDVRFTVWSIWPLWNLSVWCLKVESNRRQRDFQSLALPTELSRQIRFWKSQKTGKKMATQTRLELVTSSVTGWRSNQTELLGRATGYEKFWWAFTDSNRGPIGYEPTALTTELKAHTTRRLKWRWSSHKCLYMINYFTEKVKYFFEDFL